MNTNDFVNRVITLRTAQQNYLANRGDDRLGQAVAEAARLVDEAIDQLADEPRQHVYAAIDGERDFQDEMTARSDRPDMIEHLSVGDTLLAMEENLERARCAWYGGSVPHEDAMGFVRKVCALGVKAGEVFGMPRRDQ